MSARHLPRRSPSPPEKCPSNAVVESSSTPSSSSSSLPELSGEPIRSFLCVIVHRWLGAMAAKKCLAARLMVWAPHLAQSTSVSVPHSGEFQTYQTRHSLGSHWNGERQSPSDSKLESQYIVLSFTTALSDVAHPSCSDREIGIHT